MNHPKYLPWTSKSRQLLKVGFSVASPEVSDALANLLVDTFDEDALTAVFRIHGAAFLAPLIIVAERTPAVPSDLANGIG